MGRCKLNERREEEKKKKKRRLLPARTSEAPERCWHVRATSICMHVARRRRQTQMSAKTRPSPSARLQQTDGSIGGQVSSVYCCGGAASLLGLLMKRAQKRVELYISVRTKLCSCVHWLIGLRLVCCSSAQQSGR